MRPLFALLLIIAVIWAGWDQPFRDHASALFPNAGIAPSRLALAAQRANAASQAEANAPQTASAPQPLPKNPEWMWKEGSMARPYK